MVSYMIYYSLGIVVSLVSIGVWIVIMRSQLKQFRGNSANSFIKKVLIAFGIISILSNFVPIWFDIYQLQRHAHPSNIGIAYNTSQYLFRTATAFMFYLIYRI